MSKCDVVKKHRYNIENNKIYNLKDILANFTKYYGISIKELLSNYNVISWDNINNYIFNNNKTL